MNNQFFQTLLTKKARFLNGENPSPAKLSAINAQIENAFSIIESFLGNGTDYLVTSGNRKLLPNISSSIGTGEKIYKPVNLFHSLEQINKKYIGGVGTYDDVNKVLTLPASTTVTIHVPQGSILGLYYQTITSNPVNIVYNTNQGGTFSASASGYTWAFLPEMNTTESIVITCTGGVRLKSFVISNNSDGISPINNGKVANIAYSIPFNNNVYFKVRTPCTYADSLKTGSQRCTSKTCDYCIGNGYDLTTPGASGFGAPICLGGVPASGGTTLWYSANTSTSYKTFQSPLLTVDNPYTAKYMPFKLYDNIASGVMIPSNTLFLYDTSNQSIPIIQNVDFYSASSVRGDIVFIKDQFGVSDTIRQYLIIGGGYGMANLLWDILGLVKGY